jgi:hypothetical protein
MEIKKKAKIHAFNNKLGNYGRIEVAGKDLFDHVDDDRLVDIIIIIPD